MNHNFKPGDLALTLVDLPGHVRAGSCVEVHRILLAGDSFEMADGPRRTLRDGVVVVWMDHKYVYLPSQLMPLRGDFAPEQSKSREVPA